MRELTVEEVKKIELDILIELDAFCKKNNLHYFLAYGTLLGAIRHKGFIPWDDDIDVTMPRDDYNWLLENYNTMNPNGKYKIISPYAKEARHSFIKFIDTNTTKVEVGIEYNYGYLGIDVDIFPLDGQPDSTEQFNKWFDKLMKIYKLFLYCILDSKTKIKRRIACPIIRILSGGPQYLLKKALNLHMQYPYKTSKFVGVTECLYINKGDRFEKECFEKSLLADFEGYKFPIPVGYDRVLTNLYGDYMTLPPEEKRVTHHINKMYINDEK